MVLPGESSTRRPRLSRWAMSNPDGPVTANFFHRRADTSLDILVVGGSIDGLAAAYNLKQAGHSVRIFEKLGTRGGSRASNLQHRAKGCMRSPPNMVKCLQQWGLKPRLDCGIPVTKIQFLDGTSCVCFSPWPRLTTHHR